MSNDSVRFSAGDVPTGTKLHASTSRKIEVSINDSAFRVEGKGRPVLVLRSNGGGKEYWVLEFTSKKPDSNYEDFYCKENGKLRSFGSMLGFSTNCYMRIYPPLQMPDSLLRPSNIKKFSELALQAIIKEHLDRYMKVLSESDVESEATHS